MIALLFACGAATQSFRSDNDDGMICSMWFNGSDTDKLWSRDTNHHLVLVHLLNLLDDTFVGCLWVSLWSFSMLFGVLFFSLLNYRLAS